MDGWLGQAVDLPMWFWECAWAIGVLPSVYLLRRFIPQAPKQKGEKVEEWLAVCLGMLWPIALGLFSIIAPFWLALYLGKKHRGDS